MNGPSRNPPVVIFAIDNFSNIVYSQLCQHLAADYFDNRYAPGKL